MDAPTQEHLARRALFPRGLVQPEAGFRFGADTLLLSAFAHALLTRRRPLAGLDLGAGCGAAGFGLLLLRPEQDLRVTGLDIGPEMVAAAKANADALGLSERHEALCADVEDFSFNRGDRGGRTHDFALANPPFRAPGTGRACPDPERSRARFEGPGGFAAFAACAARGLRPGGLFVLVHLCERLPGLLGDLLAAGLSPRRLVPVQGRAQTPPRLCLLAATRAPGGKEPRADALALSPPLVLYGPDGSLTPEAAAFCPHLLANPRRTRA